MLLLSLSLLLWVCCIVVPFLLWQQGHNVRGLGFKSLKVHPQVSGLPSERQKLFSLGSEFINVVVVNPRVL